MLTIQYLGVSGFLLEQGDEVILTAPMYSNPSLVELAADHEIRPDAAQVDRFLPAEAEDAIAILVGHSHYDHLLDVSYIAERRAPNAKIYGSATMGHLLAPFAALRGRVEVIDGVAGDHADQGEWVHVSPTARFMALRSEHSTQVTFEVPITDQPVPIHLWRGRLDQDRRERPRSASEWPEGRVYAYLIDFLDADRTRPLFRVYFQDSGTNEPIGYVPEAMVREKRVDVALLCVGGDFKRLHRHPEGIIENTRPRFVLLGHWEDFFVTQDNYAVDERVYPIPSFERHTEDFVKRARRALRTVDPDAELWLPCPTRSTFVLSRSSTGGDDGLS
jgi:L-ascorbate metabolism protein UlaG (beta-lactamase superfamily)